MIGIALAVGLLAAGCRPIGLPTVTEPVETTTTTSTAITPTPATGESSALTPEPKGMPGATEPPAVEVDLTELRHLLSELDSVLSDVDHAMTEGEQ